MGDTLPLLTGSSDTCIGEENTTHLAMGDTLTLLTGSSGNVSVKKHW